MSSPGATVHKYYDRHLWEWTFAELVHEYRLFRRGTYDAPSAWQAERILEEMADRLVAG